MMHTRNIDNLASKSVLFEEAYVQVSLAVLEVCMGGIFLYLPNECV